MGTNRQVQVMALVALMAVAGCGPRPGERAGVAPGFPPEAWREMADLIAANWVRDLADDFTLAIAVAGPEARAQLVAAYATVGTWWAQDHVPGDFTARTWLERQPRAELEALARHLRAAATPLRAAGLLPQLPRPEHPPGLSGAPFGDAITVAHGAAPDVLVAYELQLEFSSAALAIDAADDVGRPPTAAEITEYRRAHEVMRPSDYAPLAAHQVRGLEHFWGHAGFDAARFADGLWGMTSAGEWTSSLHSLARWLKWLDAWDGILATGEVPDLTSAAQATVAPGAAANADFVRDKRHPPASMPGTPGHLSGAKPCVTPPSPASPSPASPGAPAFAPRPPAPSRK